MIVCIVVVLPSCLREPDAWGGVAVAGGEVGVVGVAGAGGVVGVEGTLALELDPSNPLGLLCVAVSSGNATGARGGVATGVDGAGIGGSGVGSLGGGGGRGSKPSTGIVMRSANALALVSCARCTIFCDSSSPSHVPSSGTLKCSSGRSPGFGSPYRALRVAALYAAVGFGRLNPTMYGYGSGRLVSYSSRSLWSSRVQYASASSWET